MGYSRHAGEPVDELPAGWPDEPRDVLFGTGSALFVRAPLFAELGGFDERFFMFYEDVDLGWRLNLRGWRVRYVPSSLAFHRRHASMRALHPARETYLLERNALATLYKNASDATLAAALPAALALTVRRATARGALDPTQLEITRAPARADDPGPVAVPPETLAGLLAIDQFVELLGHLHAARAAEQAARVRTDADLAPLLRNALEPAYPLPRYLAAHDVLVEVFGLDELYGRPRRVLVLTGDALGERMAGPAIRAWHIAEVLAAEHDVRLVTVSSACTPAPAPFPVRQCRPRDLTAEVRDADVVVLQGHVLEMAPVLKDAGSTTVVVCDLYDPMHLELLEQGRDPGPGAARLTDDQARAADLAGATRVVNEQLRRGDFFLCASDRQRYFWLGHLAALGRLGPTLYDADPSARSLLAVAPFGLPDKPPQRTGPGIRGTHGITEDHKVILWAGGVYSWFDPITLLRAIDRLRARRDDVRLVFLGMRHPNPDVPAMGMAGRARTDAERLDLGGQVVFNETWVPYAERANWLLDADCGVTTHFEHVETTFAFRTRVLDYLWAGLPIVTTDGDSFAELVRAERLGVVVPAEEPDALAAALERVLYDAEFATGCRERIAAVRDRFGWERTLAPLVEFCRHPRPAADRLAGQAPLVRAKPLGAAGVLRRDLRLAREYLAAGGPAELAWRAAGRVRRLTRRR